MLATCACLCNSSDSLIRNFLKQANYQDWLAIPIVKGKEKSRSLISTLPNFPEKQELDRFIQNSSKWGLIIGYNENGMRWADIAHYNPKTRIDAEHIVDTFAE